MKCIISTWNIQSIFWLHNLKESKKNYITFPWILVLPRLLWSWPGCCKRNAIVLGSNSGQMTLGLPGLVDPSVGKLGDSPAALWLTAESFCHKRLCYLQKHVFSIQGYHWASCQYPACWQQFASHPLGRKKYMKYALEFCLLGNVKKAKEDQAKNRQIT